MNIKKIIIYLILFVGLLLLLDKVIMPAYVHREEVKVPNVVGMTYEQGKLILEQNGLEPIFGGERYDTKYPKGTIILQKPAANKTVKIGRNIYLIVSSGNVKIEVPNVLHKRVDEASIILNNSGLSIGSIFEDSISDAPGGLVTSQSISPGELVEKGTEINLSVSTGKPSGDIEVPNLIGKSFSEIKSILESKNLIIGKVVYQPSLEYLPNTVVYQYPSAGSFVKEATPIDLIVVKEKVSEKEIIE